jgi:histone-lysine N-methyltransferase SETMAR
MAPSSSSPTPPTPTKNLKLPSPSTVFWDCERVTLEDVTPRGETVNSDAYIRIVTELRNLFKKVWSHKNLKEILLLHDNARPHTSLKIWEAITKFGWTMLSHPPNSPNLAPSKFHTLRALKDAICGTTFESKGDVIHALSTWLYEQEKAQY